MRDCAGAVLGGARSAARACAGAVAPIPACALRLRRMALTGPRATLGPTLAAKPMHSCRVTRQPRPVGTHAPRGTASIGALVTHTQHAHRTLLNGKGPAASVAVAACAVPHAPSPTTLNSPGWKP
eukprot:362449-Chlamydomonas_euryale.AAC.4